MYLGNSALDDNMGACSDLGFLEEFMGFVLVELLAHELGGLALWEVGGKGGVTLADCGLG